jgi:class 3 adenylate cyclase
VFLLDIPVFPWCTSSACVITAPFPCSESLTSGFTVNVAARVEGLTARFEAPVLVSQATMDLAARDFAFTPAPLASVKGKRGPMATFFPQLD